MTKVALLGAGGKMGVRLATNLKGSHFHVAHVEVSEAGRQRLKDAALIVQRAGETAVAGALQLVIPRCRGHPDFEINLGIGCGPDDALYLATLRHVFGRQVWQTLEDLIDLLP